MPELAEVETIVNYLNKCLLGKKIKKVEILKAKSFIGKPKEIIGSKITSIERRAKYIIINLSNNKLLLIHLKMSGQLILNQKSNIKYHWKRTSLFKCRQKHILKIKNYQNKYTRVIIYFTDNTQLLFNDLRIFGYIKVKEKIKNIDNLIGVKLGVEPLSKDLTIQYLQEIFSKTKKPIKLVLMDQNKIAGIGNIYANEILFNAKINPKAHAKDIKISDIKILKDSIQKILKKAIKYKGSTASDKQYLQADGTKGSFQKHFMVYQKDKEKCKICGTLIKRIKLGGRGTSWCPKCQKS